MDTIENNILMYRNKYAKKVKGLMDIFGLKEIDLNRVCNKELNLSGGEKYRISFIRAIIDHPDLLIVDEPTAALDKENSKKIYRYLNDLESTVVIITHDESANEYFKADYTIHIKDKKVSVA